MIIGAAPSLDDLQRLAEINLARLPEDFRQHLHAVAIRVEDFPDDETLSDLDLEDPFDLLGLYRGISMTERSVSDIVHAPDMIFLYRRPLLDYWVETGEPLERVIRHVLVHEIGHHFGFSDADMDAIEAQMD